MPSNGYQEMNELCQMLSNSCGASLHHTPGSCNGLHLGMSTRENCLVYMCMQAYMYQSMCTSLCKCMSVMRKGPCIPVRSQHVSPPCLLAIFRADLVRCSTQMQSYPSLCPQSAVLPWAWCCRACGVGCRLKRVCGNHSGPRRTCWAILYPSSFWAKQLRYFH